MRNPVRPLHDQPLPAGLASKLAGYASTARQYPIFGSTWFGYRMRSFLAPMVLLALLVGVIGAVMPAAARVPAVYLALAVTWLAVALALALGRALAVVVCRQQWPARLEVAGVVFALLIGILVPLALTPLTSVGQAAKGARAPTPAQVERARENRLVNLAIWFVVLAWLAGSLDLVAWLRQRRLLHDTALLGEVARYKDERNEVEMRLAILASQVEPHFLFNTLSGVRAAMLSDPARGVAMIDHLVDYLRATIPQLRADQAHPFVSLGSQLDAAQAYLGIITARMPRLQSRIDCPPGLRDTAMPPLMLISLVENAVKHGIELKKGPGMIHVSAACKDGARLELSVADDGVGFGAATTGTGIGLVNIRERLQHLFGAEAALALRAGVDGGMVASIVLPLRPMQDSA
ncbi:sensor histidine kinase [Massilia sp. S19_KUP03_FR1]|uniref:sensor histidine kinase n=1 Tax=Massilia sp. S19_KUP03_FR1 TaxID=3025503 RepID=UPI002FCDCED0